MATKVKELADAEAERVEGEEDEPVVPDTGGSEAVPEEEEEAEAATPPPAVEPGPVGIGPEEIRKAEQATAAQRKKLAKILGPDMVALDCPMCAALGFVPELPPVETTFRLIETEGGYGFDVQAPGDLSQYPEARDKEPCDWCGGMGQVRTGSKFPPAMVMGCTKCSGNGWVIKPVAGPGNGAATSLPGQALPTPSTVATHGIVDAWGRTAPHEFWGVPPEQVQG